MTLRAQHRWRIGLTIATAIMFIVGGVSCVYGPIVGHFSASGVETSVSIRRGAVYCIRQDRSSWTGESPATWTWDSTPVEGRPVVEFVPVVHVLSASPLSPARITTWGVRLPLWIPLLLLGGPCGWLWWRHVKRPAGLCANCGYDLQGLTSGKCPECGSAAGAGHGVPR